jgi:hypothetical protein
MPASARVGFSETRTAVPTSRTPDEMSGYVGLVGVLPIVQNAFARARARTHVRDAK